MQISRCLACNAPVPPGTARCAYCGQYFVRDDPARGSLAQRGPGVDSGLSTAQSPEGTLLFQRVHEPNEGAFTLLVPHGWQMQGGILRANVMQQAVDAQSIEAKIDFGVQRDAEGSVAIRWCPDVKYCDMRFSPAGMMGFFPPGSLYQGMIVSPAMSPADFLAQVVFPWAHPEATQMQVVSQKPLPLLVQIYKQKMASLRSPTPGSYEGGTVTFVYTEGGQRYAEKAYAVIENLGPMAAGMWSNKDTLLVRAPQGQLARWEPILHRIRESVKIDFHWLAQEMVNQEFLSRSFLNAQQAAMARDRRVLEVQRQMQDVDRQITEHHTRTRAEIHNDNYLALMDQEEYLNPFTNEPETGSNQWQNRWITEGGDEFYTDNEDHDPNLWGLLNSSDWRRTSVRPRFGG